MKNLTKIFLAADAILFFTTLSHADDRTRIRTTDGEVSLAAWQTPTWSQSTAITISSSSLRNCLSDLTVVSTNTYTFKILTEGTTVYGVTGAAAGSHPKTWGTNTPLCGAAAQRIFINTSCSGCTPDINYQTFTAK